MFQTLLAVFALFALFPSGGTRMDVPVSLEAGHFYAVPRTRDGHRLRLLVDTGGGTTPGMYWITQAAARRLHLKTSTCKAGGTSFEVVAQPDYAPGEGLPPANGPCKGEVLVQDVDYGRADGQIVPSYLAGRIWTFDYPRHRLTMQGADWRPPATAHRVWMGFQKDGHGHVRRHYPRIAIRVAGQRLDMLLDTGATAFPTPAGTRATGAPTVHGMGTASYITTSTMDRWHAEHPDWRMVRAGDSGAGGTYTARLIEVPEVGIGGWTVGPVWFTERPDGAFHGMMASLMDKPPEGAVGANILRHFRMTLDYPGHAAWLQCASGCRTAPGVGAAGGIQRE